MKKKIIAIVVATIVTVGGLSLGVKIPSGAAVVIGDTFAKFATAEDDIESE
jgi:hypothetical protein